VIKNNAHTGGSRGKEEIKILFRPPRFLSSGEREFSITSFQEVVWRSILRPNASAKSYLHYTHAHSHTVKEFLWITRNSLTTKKRNFMVNPLPRHSSHILWQTNPIYTPFLLAPLKILSLIR